ncbi:MAG: nucleotidyltransferase domain-containing protein [Pseudomonadota bacterium]
MRLSERNRAIIRDTVREVVGEEADVHLFGSRTDDTGRGGDIDLLITSDTPVVERERKALRVVARLQRRLGDQPIDVLIVDPDTPLQAVHREALRTGVRL